MIYITTASQLNISFRFLSCFGLKGRVFDRFYRLVRSQSPFQSKYVALELFLWYFHKGFSLRLGSSISQNLLLKDEGWWLNQLKERTIFTMMQQWWFIWYITFYREKLYFHHQYLKIFYWRMKDDDSTNWKKELFLTYERIFEHMIDSFLRRKPKLILRNQLRRVPH